MMSMLSSGKDKLSQSITWNEMALTALVLRLLFRFFYRSRQCQCRLRRLTPLLANWNDCPPITAAINQGVFPAHRSDNQLSMYLWTLRLTE